MKNFYFIWFSSVGLILFFKKKKPVASRVIEDTEFSIVNGNNNIILKYRSNFKVIFWFLSISNLNYHGISQKSHLAPLFIIFKEIWKFMHEKIV